MSSPRSSSFRSLGRRAVVAFALLSAACGDSSATKQQGASHIGGALVVSTVADADLLMPPLTITGAGLQVTDAVFDRLVQPSIDSNGALVAAPALAKSWTWSADSMAIDFVLNEKAKWHDGVAVTAGDVRFTFLAYTDSLLGAPARESLRDIDSVQAVATNTVRVWFGRRTPSQFDDATLQMRILPQHALDSIPRVQWRTSAFARKPVGSGRFRFASWQGGTRIEVVADSANYRGRPNLDRVVWSVAPDPAAATLRMLAGDADFIENVRPDAVAEFAANPNVKLLRSPALAYGYVQFNLLAAKSNSAPHPLFSSPELRRAISMGVDRSRLVAAVFDTLARVALGPVTRIQLAGDTLLPSIPFDTSGASRILDSLGWRAPTPGGVRARNSVPLQFAMLVPSSSTQRVRIATIMQPMLRAIGVDMRIESLEFTTFMARLGAGDFDAAVMALGADLDLGGIRGAWGSGAVRALGGPNFGSYRSAAFDAAVDSAVHIANPVASRKAFVNAYRVILADAPAVWLYEPYSLSAMSKTITPAGIRPDGWWVQLGDWYRSDSTSR